MSEEIICPDCGGVIGGEPGSGRAVCRCFEPRRTVVAPPAPPSDPVTDHTELNQKLCRICSRDLRGHRRLKDSRGYICLDCDAAERGVPPAGVEQDLSLIPCPECGRKLKPEGITTLNGAVMCKRCVAEFKELRKYKAPPPGLEIHKEAEKQSLRNLLILAGVLMLIMLLAWLGWIGQ
ncbi:MAG TPA: hypothetical protein VF595_14740 [Tepidisphaeraceae bacterium]|jgi:DNA-directed RNA polymerase subunit RPC12/RpoP